ncbi:MAG: SDR family NAD(P)-dependent oxidoreductase, partial [Spirochaetales bacterium]|nr:SDR family NAD(P)-dependent oxidoreductase [Spirochaetales bacterium]
MSCPVHHNPACKLDTQEENCGGGLRRVVVTGASGGIGKATAILFLEKGHEVIGLDCKASAIDDRGYTHHIADISDKASLPEIDGV